MAMEKEIREALQRFTERIDERHRRSMELPELGCRIKRFEAKVSRLKALRGVKPKTKD